MQINHQEMVAVLKKKGENILSEITPQCADLMHMAMGISGESGELLDAIKKHTIYRKPLDIDNIIEELGDLEFFMEGLRAALGITREQTLEANIAKLGDRYKGFKYSNQAAIDRADKNPVDKG